MSNLPPFAGISILGQSKIPFILVSSGSMGNNGALSSITALSRTYPNAYIYLPAAAISTGSAAGWYYTVFSSSTAGTVYNNTYTSGTPTIPTSPTAFSTTGPGSFTQTTTSLISGYTLPIAGNIIGKNGAVRVSLSATYNNTSGVKEIQLKFGTASFGLVTPSTTGGLGAMGGFSNMGATNIQTTLYSTNLDTASHSSTPFYGTVDTTVSQNLIVQMELNTNATDTLTIETIIVELIPGV
jgi:hypothetical protein